MKKRGGERWNRTHDQMRQEVLVALRGGKSISQITGQMRRGKYVTGIVCGDTLKILRSEDAEFDAFVGRVAPENARANNVRGRSIGPNRKRTKTHCKRGHPLSGDNLYRFDARGYRKCKACQRVQDAFGRKLNEDQARRVVASLQEGHTITQVTRSSSPLYIVNATALVLFRQRNPKFNKLVTKLSNANAKVHHDEASVRRREIYRARVIEPNAENIFARVRAAVPASLGAQVQAEVIASMSLAVIEGRIQPQQIETSVREFVRDYYRQFSNYGPVSLDQPLFEDSGMTLGDTVTRNLWG